MKHLLVVDDHTGLREVFRLHMEREGFIVSEAEDGVDGLMQIKKLHPDLIVLDLMMPRLNGWEVLQSLKRDGVKIPVIVITGYAESCNIEEIRCHPNVVGFKAKPMSYKDLIQEIHHLLGTQTPEPAAR